ncbi:EamA family transporter RarD [Veronia pacifica]|uniref:Permease n=1 Tax=Veronia pacifica TaxID=1080227 RepID=A0A1C3EG85_9GAMM|nr:EamA family transporter RarD [Veronia pacifica]ODA32240.1 permease [Veronia pacifica]
MTNRKSGNVLAALAFVLWGFVPLYYQFIPNAAMDEMAAIRVIVSVPILLLASLLITRRLPDMQQIWQDKKSFLYSSLATVMMTISWVAFIWALTNNKVLEASMGFFINPLIVISLGVLFLKEQLSMGQRFAVSLAAMGLSYQIWQYGELPVSALLMAIFFALYGLSKKKVAYSTLTSLFVEHLVLLPIALVYMVYKIATGTSVAIDFSSMTTTTTLMLYIGAAPMTLIPLFIFNAAVKRTSLSMIGFMQYLEPSLQFLCAVLLFGEVFDEVKIVSFGLIWLGLAITVLEGILKIRKRYSGISPNHL